MWHRIENGIVVESVEEFGDEWMRHLTPGQLRERFGWVCGVESIRPTIDPMEERAVLYPRYDPHAGTVLEMWSVEPLSPDSPLYVAPHLRPKSFDPALSGAARERRIIAKIAKTDPVAALLRREKI